MADSVILKLPCSGTAHRLRIHWDGRLEMLDHDEDMIQAFTAFGATTPECLLAASEWRDAWPTEQGLALPVRLGRAMQLFERFLDPMQIRLIGTDWAWHTLPLYESVKKRGKIATLPRRMIRTIRAHIRKGLMPPPGMRGRAATGSTVGRALAPIRAEMLQGERYIEQQRNEQWGAGPYDRYTAAYRALEAASNCYYLIIPLGGWYIKPPSRHETLEQVISIGMKAQEAYGSQGPRDQRRAARHKEQRWQLWHAAKVIAAVQGGKRWPRVA
jgi:hypothetical protein